MTRIRLGAVLVVLALLSLGLTRVHAADLPLSVAPVTTQEGQRCAGEVKPLTVEAADTGQAVVITDLPGSCKDRPVHVEVASSAEGIVFTGDGETSAEETMVPGTAVRPPLKSARERAVSVVVDGWPLPAQWIPSPDPIYSTKPKVWTVENLRWETMNPQRICAYFDVVNVSDQPVRWEVAADLSAIPFNGATTIDVAAPYDVAEYRITGTTLYLQLRPGVTLAPDERETRATLCATDVPPPPKSHPGPDTYEVSSVYKWERNEHGHVAAACASVTVRDLRSSGFEITWYADVDWGAVLHAAVAAGALSQEDAESLRAMPLHWNRSGAYTGAVIDPAGPVYRVVGTIGVGYETPTLSPREERTFLGCTDG